MIKYLTYITLIFCCLSFKTDSSLKEVLDGFQKNYKNNSVSMKYTIYQVKGNSKDIYEMGETQYTKNSYYNTQGQSGIFIDTKYTIGIDDIKKSLTITNTPVNTFNLETKFPIDSTISLIKKDYEGELEIQNGNYIVSCKLYEYNMHYYFDKTYKLKKVVYEFIENEDIDKMVVEYKEIKIGSQLAYNSFKKLIKITTNKIEGIGAYSNYQILDNR